MDLALIKCWILGYTLYTRSNAWDIQYSLTKTLNTILIMLSYFKDLLNEAVSAPYSVWDWCFIVVMSMLFLCVVLYSFYDVWDKHEKLILRVWTILSVLSLVLLVVHFLNLLHVFTWMESTNGGSRTICCFAYLVFLVLMIMISKRYSSIWNTKWYAQNVEHFDNDIAYYENLLKSHGNAKDHADLRERVEDLKRRREEVLSKRPHR